ncbi:uncharacterized protein BO72DRAFT_99848 [Aspergillus fijiensis CBS 313.89]|uniref:Uncharacterized protein n=1 Tax=Aspergillus fijiensis CBS 313.89 TaxID=1448319 RepID=A0A8G1VYB8_9EURO|nr:uncharacterized protein BO72DRAFT_99848 [Aspergillus fijiensis CBS 313.89]RAK77565.1 hypothetical protein BO72DRAFT_99848 [Aspergillus fijiensis CBS 313.89]
MGHSEWSVIAALASLPHNTQSLTKVRTDIRREGKYGWMDGLWSQEYVPLSGTGTVTKPPDTQYKIDPVPELKTPYYTPFPFTLMLCFCFACYLLLFACLFS